MSIYANVQTECKKNNTNIMQLEKKLGFPRGSIFKWDAHKPSVLKVKAVADELNTTVDALLKGEE